MVDRNYLKLQIPKSNNIPKDHVHDIGLPVPQGWIIRRTIVELIHLAVPVPPVLYPVYIYLRS